LPGNQRLQSLRSWKDIEDGVPGRNFNKMLVDAGQAEIKDFKNNEFDPWSWWS